MSSLTSADKLRLVYTSTYKSPAIDRGKDLDVEGDFGASKVRTNATSGKPDIGAFETPG